VIILKKEISKCGVFQFRKFDCLLILFGIDK
jgi:hypothetical protein